MRTLLVFGLLLPALPVAAQDTVTPDPGVGLQASLQSNQLDLTFPIWLGERFAVAPSIGFAVAEDVGSDFTAVLALRLYQKTANPRVRPYIGPRGGVLAFLSSSGGDTEGQVDFLVGLGLGVEYFLTSHFTVSIEPQFNVTFSDENSLRFGNPDRFVLNTATLVSATIYF